MVTTQNKVEGGACRFFDDFRSDIYLTLDDGMEYNEGWNLAVHEMAKELKEKMRNKFQGAAGLPTYQKRPHKK